MRLAEIGSTSQSAPLERLLSGLRSRRLGNRVRGKRVIDFGCGIHAWNSLAIAGKVDVVHGVDASIKNSTDIQGVQLYQSLTQLPLDNYNFIVALAVFEHIPPFDLVEVLRYMHSITTPDAQVFGTVPTPRARPILEFLSFRLGLIDPSQIADHWVYYDDLWLKEIVSLTDWKVVHYSRFQLGMNSQFLLEKQ